MEEDLLWYFHIFNDTLTSVSSELCGVEKKLEAVRSIHENLDGSLAVEFSHTFYFYKVDIISILEWMSFVFVHSNDAFRSLGNVRDDEAFGLFSVFVSYFKAFTVIEENISCSS